MHSNFYNSLSPTLTLLLFIGLSWVISDIAITTYNTKHNPTISIDLETQNMNQTRTFFLLLHLVIDMNSHVKNYMI